MDSIAAPLNHCNHTKEIIQITPTVTMAFIQQYTEYIYAIVLGTGDTSYSLLGFTDKEECWMVIGTMRKSEHKKVI